MAGFGSMKCFPGDAVTWKGLDEFLNDHLSAGHHVLGYLSYDVKNRIEDLTSENPDRIGFPEMFFMVPEVLVTVADGITEVRSATSDPEKIFDEIRQESLTSEPTSSRLELKPAITRQQYLDRVSQLKDHIQRGDIYEVNFCHEFYSDNAQIDAYDTYIRLGKSSANPFGCFVKHDGRFLLCASPERFLKKTSGVLTSQPMKGTMPRHADPALDDKNRSTLESSEKDRAENVMIVDLTRNDLSRIAKPASVRVPELFRVHSFPHVHQMISTVQCDVRDDATISGILRATFPMGSMTGAPKVRAMQLIEEHEPMKRGIFSGTVGYFSPDGDFDLNVVIRSIMYSEDTQSLSVMAGGAITSMSDPELEYHESMLKMKPLFDTLGYTLDPATGEYA
jgi:para-aminobenzoate synthetase component 1